MADLQHRLEVSDIIRRRIFALEFDIIFTNPFSGDDETLCKVGGRQ